MYNYSNKIWLTLCMHLFKLRLFFVCFHQKDTSSRLTAGPQLTRELHNDAPQLAQATDCLGKPRQSTFMRYTHKKLNKHEKTKTKQNKSRHKEHPHIKILYPENVFGNDHRTARRLDFYVGVVPFLLPPFIFTTEAVIVLG